MKKIQGLDFYDITASAILGFGITFFIYWLCGGNFERNWKLGLTFVLAVFLWSYLLEKRHYKKTKHYQKPTKHDHDPEYL